MERKKVVEALPITFTSGEPILRSHFRKVIDDPSTDTCYQLHQKCVLEIGPNGRPVRKIGFCFQLLFGLIRQSDEAGKLGPPYGINFELLDDQLNLYSSNVTELREWKEILSKKLNQKSFHRHYKPIKKIGRGSFASVYLAFRLEDDKKFAVKAFSKETCYTEDDGKDALRNEIQLMRMLNHKNLMSLYEVFESESSVYLCVQLLEGGQLYDLVKVKHKFKCPEIIGLMRGLLEGLQHMHAKRIMHRDLKPQNILLRGNCNGDCVIADFGLSVWADQPKYLYVRCGTPGYVAPEIVNIRDMSAKFEPVCDMFSVGIIFHILVMGKSPFSGRTYNQVLSQNRACSLNFETCEYSRIPEVTLDLLTKMLQKNPRDRITAEEALKHGYFSKEFELTSHEDESDFLRLRRVSRNAANMCYSPMMTTADPLRKKKDKLREDSLMKFKMQQNVMTGKTETNQSIDSASLVRQQQPPQPLRESRFARRSSKLERPAA